MKVPVALVGNDKQRGEWAELRFMAKARELGFEVSKPFGDSSRYDVIVEADGRLVRVQVKSTMARNDGGYLCRLNGARTQNYTGEEIDFFAVYVIPEDVWYLLPIEVGMRVKGQIFFMPNRERQKYAAYQEAWHLLKGAAGKVGKKSRDKKVAESGAEHTGDQALIGEWSETIPQMRGEIEGEATAGFDAGVVRGRLAGCCERMRR